MNSDYKKDVSIIIPTREPKEYLYECLDSISEQTLNKERFEIIIILNGLRQPYYSQILDYCEKHKSLSVKLFYTSKTGISNARNIGLSNAAGKDVLFIDDDDFISDTYLTDLLLTRMLNPNAIIISNTISFDDRTRRLNKNFYLSRCYQKLYGKTRISLFQSRSIFNGVCMKLLPQDIAKSTRFDTDFEIGEDTIYMYQISNLVTSITLAPRTAVYYRRIRQNSASTTNRSFNFLYKLHKLYMKKIASIYFPNICSYNFSFTISRIVANYKSLLKLTIKNIMNVSSIL